MGDQPWNRNEGKYDRPSSGRPGEQLRDPFTTASEASTAAVDAARPGRRRRRTA